MDTEVDPQGYLAVVREAMVKHGIADGGELVAALLYVLDERHTNAIWSGRDAHFHDGMTELTRRKAISPADSLRNLCRLMASLHGHNAANQRDKRPGTEPRHLDFLSSRLDTLTEVLSDLLPGWEAKGEKLKAQLEAMPMHISPREGDRADMPWEGRPVDFDGNVVDRPWDGRTRYDDDPPQG